MSVRESVAEPTWGIVELFPEQSFTNSFQSLSLPAAKLDHSFTLL
jgi:hypothetical protein